VLTHESRQATPWLIFDVRQKTRMSPSDILEELARVRSDFRAHWEGENLFRDDDGSFTACGVFSQFTDFFREKHQLMRERELGAIAALISRCERDQFLADVAYTCFLENIAGDPADATLAPYLSPTAREFMSHWRAPE
jgi:hypothetical protein